MVILYFLAKVLKAVNDRNIVHGDIKAENIMLTVPMEVFDSDGSILAAFYRKDISVLTLIDFGAARAFGEYGPQWGTVPYISQDYRRGNHPASAAVDMRAFTGVAYHLIHLQEPENLDNPDFSVLIPGLNDLLRQCVAGTLSSWDGILDKLKLSVECMFSAIQKEF